MALWTVRSRGIWLLTRLIADGDSCTIRSACSLLREVILRTGEDVTEFKPGDRICAIVHGTHRTLLRRKTSACQRIPRGVSFEEVACLPLSH